MKHHAFYTKISPLCGALFAAVANAQPIPNIGDAMRQAPSGPPPAKIRAVPNLVPEVQTLKYIRSSDGGPKIEVTSFQFQGNRVISADELYQLLFDEHHNSFTLGELEEMTTKVTRYYRNKGYFVARAYVPEQKIVGGKLTIRIVEGNYGRFILQNKSLVRDDVLQAMLDNVIDEDIVSVNTLERAMLNINATPGAQVIKAEVLPGERLGTSDFVVGTEATKVTDGFLLLDNHGTSATGKNRLSTNINWNSPTGSGDRLSFTGLKSEKSGLNSGRLGYSRSLAPSGLRGEMALGRTMYEVSPSFLSQNATPPKVTGTANIVELGLNYPLRRITGHTVMSSAVIAHKDLNDLVVSSDSSSLQTQKSSDSLTLGVYSVEDNVVAGFSGVTQSNLFFTRGRLNIKGDALQADQAESGAKTNGYFSKINFDLSRTSLLPEKFSVTGSFRVQRTLNKNLDGSERFGVAGVAGVMAYPSSQLAGSNVSLIRIELARPLPAFGSFSNQWQIIGNYGRAQPLKSDSWQSLKDVGFGWVAQNIDGFLIKAYVAQRVGKTEAIESNFPKTKIWLLGGYVF